MKGLILLTALIGLMKSSLQQDNSKVFECSFDQNFCQFVSDPEGDLIWELRKGPTPTENTGPDSDHTTGDPSKGFYSYIEVTKAKTGQFARMISASVLGTAHKCSTLSFYYYMYGNDVGSLNLYLVHDPPPYRLDNAVWSVRGNQGKKWIKAELNVTFPTNIKLVFEGIAQEGLLENNGDIAIDDISINVDLCEPITCDPLVTWCKNGGTCLDITNNASLNDYYVCNCLPGWEGVHCELEVDECESNPCINGGTCAHGINSYQCFCVMGYHGDNCEYVNLCVDPDLDRCANGGTCTPNKDELFCECVPGFTGTYCDVDINNCAPNPCVHGNCTDLTHDYSCTCDTDWMGRNCSISIGSCDFDYDLCGYETTPAVDYRWKAISGETPTLGTGPDRDHTTGEGTYMYADGSKQGSKVARAMLYSPFVTKEAVNTCSTITFWYHMLGNTVGTLNVYASGAENKEFESNPIWSVYTEQGDQWLLGEVNLSSSVPYSLIFEAISSPYVSYAGDIAIDDIQIIPDACEYEYCFEKSCQNGGTCFETSGTFVCACTELWTGATCTEDSNLCLTNPCLNGGLCYDEEKSYSCECDTSNFVGKQCEYVLGSCDFEDPDLQMCNYMNENLDFLWTLTTGSTPSDSTGPSSDHTTGNGYYIFAEASKRVNGESARIKTPTIPGSANKCVHLSFWYFMKGDNVGELAVHVEFGSELLPTPIWTKVGDDGNGWTNVRINISVAYDFQIVFEAIMRDSPIIQDNKGDIAIDDIEVFTDFDCSFESCFLEPCQNGGTCVAQGENFTCVCTSEYGGKLCETLNKCDPNPCKNGGDCTSDESNMPICLCRPGFMGNFCENIDYCFPDQCVNDATCVSGGLTYKCLCADGYEGKDCELEINDCAIEPCLNGGTCQDLLNDYSCQCTAQFVGDHCEKVTGSCDFEGDIFCGWIPDPKSDYYWMINSGPGTNWPLSGPSYDHTHQSNMISGYYIYTMLVRDKPSEGSLYRIRSPVIPFKDYANNKFSLEFFYHMQGEGIGTLTVYIEEAGNPEYSIFQLSGEQGNDWLPMKQSITVHNDWSIIIEHRPIDTIFDFGDAAIDDVTIRMAEATTEPSLAFDCNFDEDFCSFVSDPEGEIKWERNQGPTFTDDTGPDSDHTTGDPKEGYYTYLEVSRARTGDFGRILSPTIPGTADQCSTVTFYYHMFGEDIGSLNLYLVHNSPPYQFDNPVYNVVGNQGNKWLKGEVNITFPTDFQVIFEGTAQQGVVENQGDIAIDDIKVEIGGCQPITCDPSVTWCKNGGTCLDVSNNATSNDYYVCECLPGWEGVHCELDVDECGSNPCLNGGTCAHGINSYQCFCNIGYHGENCEYVDMCVDSDLTRCQNGGTCIPVQNELSCECAPGYEGLFCEVEIDECASNPCEHGTCQDLTNDYLCTCDKDWIGRNCSIRRGGCNFDDGYGKCEFSTSPVIDYSWKERSGQTPNLGTGPTGDHTTGNGVYMFADASNDEQGGARGLFYSPFVTEEVVGTCSKIRFWYYMSGNTMGTLNLYASGTGNNELETNPIWSISGDQGDQWIQGEASLSSNTPYSLVFEAVSVPYVVYRGDIAIDDVEIIPNACAFEVCSGKPCQNGGTCVESSGNPVCSCTELWTGQFCTEDSNLCLSNPCLNGGTCIDEEKSYSCECDTNMYVGNQCEYLLGSCDFEDPDLRLCNFKNQDGADIYPWVSITGSTPSDLTGPNNDHTTGDGYYLYAEATGRSAGDTSNIWSPVVPGSGGVCSELSFWYFMRGSNIGQLSLLVELEGSTSIPSPIWIKNGGDSNGWTNVKINVSVPSNFQVIYQAVFLDTPIITSDDNKGDIAIDDIKVITDIGCSYESCFVQPCLNGGTCIADNDAFKCICPDNFGGPTCQSFEPCNPNPCNNDGFCYPDENDLFACLCPAGYIGPTCEKVDFCYPYSCSNNATCVSGDSIFECECLAGYEGTQCESEINECKTEPCLNGGTCQDLINDYSCQCPVQFLGSDCEKVRGSCDFEGGSLCGWQSDPKSDFDWVIESGPGSNWPLSGPPNDHTQGSLVGEEGYYIYTPLYKEEPPEGSLYRIRSPQFLLKDFSNNQFIIDFYYHMKGDGSGSFNVYIEESNKESLIYDVNGEQGSEWIFVQRIVTVNNDWSIILEHRTKATLLYMGDVAVDDVKITLVAPLPEATTTVVTTTKEDNAVTNDITNVQPTTFAVTTTKDLNVPDQPVDGGLDTGAVIGIVIGVLIIVAFIVAGFYLIVIRPAQNQKKIRKDLKSQTDYHEGGFDNPNLTL